MKCNFTDISSLQQRRALLESRRRRWRCQACNGRCGYKLPTGLRVCCSAVPLSLLCSSWPTVS